jgi:hypothetical protein
VTVLPLRLHRTELVCLGSGVGTAEEGERLLGKVDGLPARISSKNNNSCCSSSSENSQHDEC